MSGIFGFGETVEGYDVPVMNEREVRAAAPAAAVAGDERCTSPAFAVAIGHAEKWKLHNNCK